MSEKILKNIHNTDPWISKKYTSWLAYPVAKVTVLLMFISPYRVRILLAFTLNFLFNSPMNYLNLIAKNIAKHMNFVFLTVFHFTIFGVYSLLYKFFSNITRAGKKKDSTWITIPENESEDERIYYYQS